MTSNMSGCFTSILSNPPNNPIFRNSCPQYTVENTGVQKTISDLLRGVLSRPCFFHYAFHPNQGGGEWMLSRCPGQQLICWDWQSPTSPAGPGSVIRNQLWPRAWHPVPARTTVLPTTSSVTAIAAGNSPCVTVSGKALLQRAHL